MEPTKNTAGDFTRGVMDRLRESCGLADFPVGLIRTPDGWEIVVPGAFYEFKFAPRMLPFSAMLLVKSNRNAAFKQLAVVGSEDEALSIVKLFLGWRDP